LGKQQAKVQLDQGQQRRPVVLTRKQQQQQHLVRVKSVDEAVQQGVVTRLPEE
jgi:predicted RNA-binding protein YlxR (DUF448 family)